METERIPSAPHSAFYKPTSWSDEDWAIDITDNFGEAAATGAVFEQVVGSDSAS